MEDANSALIMLTAAIFFALIIERILEVVKCLYDYIEAKNDFSDFWNRRAISIRERLHNRFQKSKDNKLQNTVFKYLASRYVNKDHPQYEGALVISANQLRTFAVKSSVKSIGAILGIVVAFGVQIDVFELIERWTPEVAQSPDTGNTTEVAQSPDTSNEVSLGLFEVNLPEWLKYTITGIIMGLGSGPMHKFITALERARRNRKSTDVA